MLADILLLTALILLYVLHKVQIERVTARAELNHQHWSTVHRRVEHQRHEIARVHEGHHELFKLLKTSVSVDVGGHHDCGWLIFIANVNGKDMVKIQHLKPRMTYQEYQELLTKLSYDCQHVAYIDAHPQYYEAFLRPTPSKGRKPW